MKKLMAMLIAVVSLSAMAETVTVLETELRTRAYRTTYASASFHMDTVTNQGYADVRVVEYYGMNVPCNVFGCYPGQDNIPRTIYSSRVEIPNLTLVDKQMLYRGINGEVNCGKLGTSRVLRRPTLYLSGKCSLGARLRAGKLTVSFNAK